MNTDPASHIVRLRFGYTGSLWMEPGKDRPFEIALGSDAREVVRVWGSLLREAQRTCSGACRRYDREELPCSCGAREWNARIEAALAMAEVRNA